MQYAKWNNITQHTTSSSMNSRLRSTPVTTKKSLKSATNLKWTEINKKSLRTWALHLDHRHNVEHASQNKGIDFAPSIRNQVENVSLGM